MRDIAAKQNRLAGIIERIADSYDEEQPKIHHLDRMPLPSREEAAEILQALEEVIYPGYHSSGGVTHQGIIYRVQERLGWLSEHLRDQISRGLQHMKDLDGDLALRGDDTAEDVAFQFLESLPRIRKMLARDIQAALAHARPIIAAGEQRHRHLRLHAGAVALLLQLVGVLLIVGAARIRLPSGNKNRPIG